MRTVLVGSWLLVAMLGLLAVIAVPVFYLLGLDDKALSRWSDIGEAIQPIGVLFSGAAFIAITVTLIFQRTDLNNQREELRITREEQQRSGEIALRQLHNDIIKMAIRDAELREVWPQLSPGVDETKKDHYCNLILNLQKMAYDTKTIELGELRGALLHLMASPDMYSFWTKARVARGAVTAGDQGEDFFTAEVDKAYAQVRIVRSLESSVADGRSSFSVFRKILSRILG